MLIQLTKLSVRLHFFLFYDISSLSKFSYDTDKPAIYTPPHHPTRVLDNLSVLHWNITHILYLSNIYLCVYAYYDTNHNIFNINIKNFFIKPVFIWLGTVHTYPKKFVIFFFKFITPEQQHSSILWLWLFNYCTAFELYTNILLNLGNLN